MAQLPERTRLKPIVDLRKALRVSPNFEFKYHKSTPRQKERFFEEVLKTPFRLRAVVVDKSRLGAPLNNLSPQQLTIELIIRLTLRASELDISNYKWITHAELDEFVKQDQLTDWFSLWVYAMAKTQNMA